MNAGTIEDVLRRTIGLDAESIGVRTLERAVAERMTACGLAEDDYLRLLRESHEELQHLIESVVVKETWFFRDAVAFDVLLQFIRSKRIGAKELHILSAPCSTGEEPYSIAMSLRDGGVDAARVTIDAVDVSSRALAQARKGCYGKNSFRTDDLSFRDRYFESTGDRFCVKDEIKSVVHFVRGNLLDLPAHKQYDAIFCRNVLIYFDAATQQAVLSMLERLLADDGRLFVGPAETYLVSRGKFVSAGAKMSFGFQKAEAAPIRVRAPVIPRPLAPRQRGEGGRRPGEATRIETPIPKSTAPDVTRARELADAGQLEEARSICDAHIAQFGPSAQTLYVLALVSDAKGESDRAESYYGRVLYLDPDHAEALSHLALLAEMRGDSAAAERYRRRARRAASGDQR